ncbi:HyaD/HybD family hydrogenase maturation endopeptidase [Corynebacterium freiburgense]|uniref:HyaD/HybD family hydrogenase maturation endopeptidase n=1 Tax=Corynebacterium freiburgense TaxID=556548 RepID=UPI0004101446|nr:HyaD/HybD family hydrogenase maturation endopeptidase [Corynebacterium freiburgense]WJZ01887.1 Hydrogenase 2 maturation protease [Corynebacterium freiburgense]
MIVLGIGNPIMGDDGIGLAIMRRLRAEKVDDLDWVPSRHSTAAEDTVEYIDGGTNGMELLPIVQDAEDLIVLDAVAGDTPGTVVVLEGDQVPRLLQSKLSPHQVGLLDLLATAKLLGHEPRRVAVVGIVPESAELHVGLSESVIQALPNAVAAVRELMARWQDPHTE